MGIAVADACEHIRDQIRDLERLVIALQAELKVVSGPLKEGLIARIKRTQATIAQKQTDLKLCEAGNPPLTDPRVFGSEITQGLAEYQLVAGKDTLARVFVGAPEPRAQEITAADFGDEKVSLPKGLHFDEPAAWGVSHLDYAYLEVSAPHGGRFEVPATMSGAFLTRSVSEKDNVNFYIDGDLLARTGRYSFVARFYLDGALVGSHALGSRDFLDSGDLRILIKVNTWPMPDAGWDTVLEALGYLQRNLPLRAGIAPLDSDRSAGLRFVIDPVPYNSGWPQWVQARAALEAFNQRQSDLGRPDRADKLFNVRMQQPGEAPLGGVGTIGGDISGAVLNVNPPGDGYYASIVTQEIGHNLTLGHSQSRFLASDTPFDLLNRRSIATAQSVMFQQVGDSGVCMLSPSDWSTARKELVRLSS